MVPVPVALEPLAGVVVQLEAQELVEPRVARLYLLARRPLVVGEVVAAAVLYRQIYQSPEGDGRAGQPVRGVDGVQV